MRRSNSSTSRYISRLEEARVLGIRAMMIASNTGVLVDAVGDDALEIAEYELAASRLDRGEYVSSYLQSTSKSSVQSAHAQVVKSALDSWVEKYNATVTNNILTRPCVNHS